MNTVKTVDAASEKVQHFLVHPAERTSSSSRRMAFSRALIAGTRKRSEEHGGSSGTSV